jgi:hypothetical protein
MSRNLLVVLMGGFSSECLTWLGMDLWQYHCDSKSDGQCGIPIFSRTLLPRSLLVRRIELRFTSEVAHLDEYTTQLGLFFKLPDLNLDDNPLTGMIPAELGQLSAVSPS